MSVAQFAVRVRVCAPVDGAFVRGTPLAKQSLSMRSFRAPVHFPVDGSAGPTYAWYASQR